MSVPNMPGGQHSTSTSSRPEAKVKASTAGAYLATFLLTALLNGVQDENHALLLGNGTPQWLETLLLPILPALVSFALGWLAPHTRRPDLLP